MQGAFVKLNTEPTNKIRKSVKNTDIATIFEEAKAGPSCHILLVEDHLMSRMLAKNFLTKCGYTVDAVESGEEAVELAQVTTYDLVLMDLNLPIMDGFETAETINQIGINSETPILALTNTSEYQVREKMYDVGINDYVGKPFNPHELYSKVKHYALGL